jgi:hypothetical protein
LTAALRTTTPHQEAKQQEGAKIVKKEKEKKMFLLELESRIRMYEYILFYFSSMIVLKYVQQNIIGSSRCRDNSQPTGTRKKSQFLWTTFKVTPRN